MSGISETKERWEESSPHFTKNINRSIFDEKEVEAWQKVIMKNAPKEGPLEILDIGTGPGFFAIILSQLGHKVTAIDCTDGMLKGAKKNAKEAGVSPVFKQMDCQHMDFKDDSFDLIVTRNVSWTLTEPIQAYKEWKRVLKPGGRMLVFDGNWYNNFFDEDAKETLAAGMLKYRQEYGAFPEGFSMFLIEDYWLQLPLVGIKRPDWDKATLWKLGFKNIRAELDLDEQVGQSEKSKLLYGCSPMFLISADKPEKKEEQLDFINRYWSSTSVRWDISCLKEHSDGTSDKYRGLFEQFLDPWDKKVLDIGAGSGAVSCMFAKAGYDVTGVDMSRDMLRHARYCAGVLGVDVKFVEAETKNLPFPDESFDVVVSRNVTWLMQDPDSAFKEWNRVLKKGGKLIYIDANWNLYLHDEEERVKFEECAKKATKAGLKKLYGTGNSSTVLIDKLSFDLPFSKIRRPDWDREHLSDFGFQVAAIKEDIGDKVYTDEEQLRYAATPLFIVCAHK